MAKKQRCEIEMHHNGKPQAISFSAAISDPHLCDLLMSEFAPLGLASHEKRELSRRDREQLCRFRNLETNDVKKHASKFLKAVAKIRAGSEVVISASDVGAYVCLAAIYSGELPDHITLSFRLKDIPVKLFPKELVRTDMPHNVDIDVYSEEDSWINRFQTICELPAHMEAKSRRRVRAAA